MIAKVWREWERFWFESEGLEQLTLFRRLLGALMFVSYSIRSLDLELYFSEKGLAPVAILGDIIDLEARYSILRVFTGTTALWIFNGVFLASLAGLALGIRPRLMATVAAVLHISFLHRNMASSYGVDLMTTYYLLYFTIADWKPGSLFTSLAYRLCQVQLCVIYAYSGMHKLKGFFWWKGEAIWMVLANPQMASADFSWVSKFPLVLTAATFATLFWETYFPALVWIPRLRKPLLLGGLLLHLGIGLTMSIPFFSALMAFTYAVFLDPDVARRVNSFLERPYFFLKEVRPAADTKSV